MSASVRFNIHNTTVRGETARVYWHGSDVNDGVGFQAVIDGVIRSRDLVDITDDLTDEEINALSDEIEHQMSSHKKVGEV